MSRDPVVHLAHICWPPKLGEAYETLKDQDKRRAYDLIYPRINKNSKRCPPSAAQMPRSTPSTASPKQDDVGQETAQISAIHKTKQERAARWSKTRKVYDDAIFSLNRDIRKLQNAIQKITEIDKAEDAEAAAANSWRTWFFSRIYEKRIETVEEKDTRARERLQRLHDRSFKETALKKKESELKDYENLLKSKQREFDCANKKDDNAILMVEERIRVKREWAQREKARLAAEASAKAWKENLERWQREADEAARIAKERREREQKLAAEQWKKQQAEEAVRRKREQEIHEAFWKDYMEPRIFARAGSYASTQAGNETYSNFAPTSKLEKENCCHEGWWDRVDGRMTCEQCSVSRYSYLLQCPECKMKACASCQQQLRPRKRNIGRGGYGEASWKRKTRTPSPPPYDNDFDW